MIFEQELLYHAFGFALLLAASVTLLTKVTNGRRYRNNAEDLEMGAAVSLHKHFIASPRAMDATSDREKIRAINLGEKSRDFCYLFVCPAVRTNFWLLFLFYLKKNIFILELAVFIYITERKKLVKITKLDEITN